MTEEKETSRLAWMGERRRSSRRRRRRSDGAKISTQHPEDADRIITRWNNNHKRSIKRAAASPSLASIQEPRGNSGASGGTAASPILRSTTKGLKESKLEREDGREREGAARKVGEITAGASGTAATSPGPRSTSKGLKERKGGKEAEAGREEGWLLSPGVVVNAIWTSITAHSANSFQFAGGERRKGTEVKNYEGKRESIA